MKSLLIAGTILWFVVAYSGINNKVVITPGNVSNVERKNSPFLFRDNTKPLSVKKSASTIGREVRPQLKIKEQKSQKKKVNESKNVIFGPESFEGTFPPTGWTQFAVPGWNQSTMNWYKKADAGHQGSNIAWIDPDPDLNLYQEWVLQTPSIDLSGCAGCSLYFYFKQTNDPNSWDWLYVWIATQGGGPSDSTWEMIGSFCQTGANWDAIYGDISPWADSQSNVVIGFEYHREGVGLGCSPEGIDYVYLTATSGGGKPNLKPFTPTGWSAPLICSVNPDTISEDTLYAGQPYYLSLAVKNEGTANINDTFAIVVTKNDTLRFGWLFPSLAQGGVVRGTCILDTIFTPGAYSMKVVADPFSQIAESDETDNVWGKTFYWKTAGAPDISVTPESLYYYYQFSKEIKEVPGYWNTNEVCVTVDIPDFQIEELGDGTQEVMTSPEVMTSQKVNIQGFGWTSKSGAPHLPAKILTLAIPPGGVVKSVDVSGQRIELAGTYNIIPTFPSLPLHNAPEIISQLMEQYNQNKEKFYSSDAVYPEILGEMRGTGGLRKYNLVDVAIYPFAYRALSKKLYYTRNLTIRITYSVDKAKADETIRLSNDYLFDEQAMELIYNYSQTRDWYTKKGGPKSTYDYVIITPNALTSACDTLVKWKSSLGYNVKVVTKEWINTNSSGDDIQQKIRNFLRDKYPSSQWGIKYVLIIGDNSDVPMRRCCPYNNDPDGPMDDTSCVPIPTDLYYADLTDPDNTSWNKDGDSYYGEVWTQSHQPPGDDSPDYHADIHVGRIPWSDVAKIRHICEKIITFEQSTDLAYKKRALLAGGVLFYQNENNQGNQRCDGADVMEALMNDGVIERTSATYLYEKAGRTPCTYSCTDSLNEQNTVNYWNNVGIFNEFNHGSNIGYYRKIWAWDDGDNVPEDAEMTWPEAFSSDCAPLVDDVHPAVGFLMSCLCGYPETTNNLGAALLYQGCVSIISATRVSWGSGENWDYCFFEKLLKDTSATHARVGDAFDLGRNNYVTNLGWEHWLNLYDFVLYGEPSLCHFGTQGDGYLSETMWVHNNGNGPLNVSNISYTQNWIASVSPLSFFVAQGDSVGVSVLVNPVGLPQGWFYDTLKISSNDPNDPVYPEKVVLQVVQSGVEEDNSIAQNKSDILLLPSSPNPFAQWTKIKFSLPIKSKVSLRIYDISGRLVRKLIEENLDAKEWSIIWDGKDEQGRATTSGVYFVKLVAGKSQLIKKLVLIR